MDKNSYGTVGGAVPNPQAAPPYLQTASAPPYPQTASAPPYPTQGPPGDKSMESYPPMGQASSYQGAPDHEEMSFPPLESMDAVPGYNNVGFDGVAIPPPSYQEAVGQRPEQEIFKSTGTITAEEARDAILEHAENQCCWSTGPAKDMEINDVISSSAYHYSLETFGESRNTKWVCEPFIGGNVYITGSPPGPWDIQATPPQMFKSSKIDMEVPNTASVKPCHKCYGQGRLRCSLCCGLGNRTCSRCGGSGHKTQFENGAERRVRCGCMGGRERCYSCHGTGMTECRKCKGRGNLRWYILLTVKWTNHLDSHVEQREDQRAMLPGELLTGVTGDMAFQETYPRVWPITTFPVPRINERSRELVTLHSTKFNMERILMQRQQVQTVPVTQVLYSYKGTSTSFFVFGHEHQVYAPDYPSKCCWGCSIL
ncbi:protein ssuh2 homolog [Plakobranchus ocellatus]|uniref:Protein ssuh2 homolog n=1 Tax=Plakobranchus ocellatus TaxID=259542 RepID=A0AAV3Z3U8_9GAST|nr:protein ssuh2 homolog [Plakobranchus ocellatus]